MLWNLGLSPLQGLAAGPTIPNAATLGPVFVTVDQDAADRSSQSSLRPSGDLLVVHSSSTPPKFALATSYSKNSHCCLAARRLLQPLPPNLTTTDRCPLLHFSHSFPKSPYTSLKLPRRSQPAWILTRWPPALAQPALTPKSAFQARHSSRRPFIARPLQSKYPPLSSRPSRDVPISRETLSCTCVVISGRSATRDHTQLLRL